MAHRVQPGQQVRIVTVELAVAADEDLDRVADAVSAILSGAIEDQDTVLLDWRYAGVERFVQAGDAPEEGDVFLLPPEIVVFDRE
jgi:hypothetical protein